ncbi:unnamed protein product [Microthlaspi erraticum]|uniref:Gamma-tubulin complex component n=1 Tax=Microthlaspi erraticum TaxID=1685480 RepID=A0A6D2J3X5_9BRAS|nr:unnamed protein product [Microthlaspi erraticum]
MYLLGGLIKLEMEQVSEILRNNRMEDINWLLSLSESELDFLTSLKKLAIQRANISGHEELAEIFDLKMLRALGLVLMEYVRERVQDDTTIVASSLVNHQHMILDNCNILKPHVDDSIDIEKILTEMCSNKSRRKFQQHVNKSI